MQGVSGGPSLGSQPPAFVERIRDSSFRQTNGVQGCFAKHSKELHTIIDVYPIYPSPLAVFVIECKKMMGRKGKDKEEQMRKQGEGQGCNGC